MLITEGEKQTYTFRNCPYYTRREPREYKAFSCGKALKVWEIKKGYRKTTSAAPAAGEWDEFPQVGCVRGAFSLGQDRVKSSISLANPMFNRGNNLLSPGVISSTAPSPPSIAALKTHSPHRFANNNNRSNQITLFAGRPPAHTHKSIHSDRAA